MATELSQYHLDVAGLAMREFRSLPNALDAQVSMAFMVCYLCSQFEIQPGLFMQTLLHNVNEIGQDPKLLNRMTERIHTISTTPRPGGSGVQLVGLNPLH